MYLMRRLLCAWGNDVCVYVCVCVYMYVSVCVCISINDGYIYTHACVECR